MQKQFCKTSKINCIPSSSTLLRQTVFPFQKNFGLKLNVHLRSENYVEFCNVIQQYFNVE